MKKTFNLLSIALFIGLIAPLQSVADPIGNKQTRSRQIAFLGEDPGFDAAERYGGLSLGKRDVDFSQMRTQLGLKWEHFEYWNSVLKRENRTDLQQMTMIGLLSDMVAAPNPESQNQIIYVRLDSDWQEAFSGSDISFTKNIFLNASTALSYVDPLQTIQIEMHHWSGKLVSENIIFAPDSVFLRLSKKYMGEAGCSFYLCLRMRESLPVDLTTLIQNESLEIRFDPKIDFLRFVDRDKVMENPERELSTFYGEKVHAGWRRAAEYVYENFATASISADTLQRIQAIAMEGLYYSGYEARRVRAAYLNAEINQETAFERLDAIAANKKSQSNPQSHLGGVFRSEPVDNLIMAGFHGDEDSVGFYTDDELFALALNPLFYVEPDSVVTLAAPKNRAKIIFTPHTMVSNAIDTAIEDFNRKVSEGLASQGFLFEVLRLQRRIVAIHPFLDGNGRSIRLFRDLILLKYGFLPPLYQVSNDYTISLKAHFHKFLENLKWGWKIRVLGGDPLNP